MLRSLLIFALAVLGFWFATTLMLREPPQQAGSAAPPPYDLEPIIPPPAGEQRAFVADVSAHTEQELETLFARIEVLLDRPRGEGEAPLVALVLHGPEVEFFALKNYLRHKALVDHAAKLAALGGVEISICQTQMRARGIAGDQVPSFLRQIPYGPEEVERLVGDNYVLM